MSTENEFQRQCSDFVAREVVYCVSSLVHDLTAGSGPEAETDEAIELWSTEPDYVDAATSNGATIVERDGAFYWHEDGEPIADDADAFDTREEAAEAACDALRIDADDYRPEVFEHWIVTSYLARKLSERGERIVDDWHGLTIWARCTTGQSIAMDEVIRDIVRELHKSVP